MATKSVPLDPAMSGDEFATGSPDVSATEPGQKKSAQDRRDELQHQEVASQNVQMRHVPTGEVTTFHRSSLAFEKLYVPALRDSFDRDQFEEYKERST